MKLLPGSADVGDDVGDVSEEGGEEDKGEEELEDDEGILPGRARHGRRADGGQGHERPVKRVQVLQHDAVALLLGEAPRLLVAIVQAEGHHVVQAGIPMEQRDHVVHQRGGAHDVGEVGVALRAVQEGPEAVDLHQAEPPEDGAEADGQVQEVQGQQAQQVDVEGGGVGVVDPQLHRVRLQDPVLQVAGPEVEGDVQHVQQVRRVVQREPHRQVLVVDLLEGEAVDDDPEVVEEGHADHAGPPVTQAAGRVEDEGPVAAVVVGAGGGGGLDPGVVVSPQALPLAELLLDVLAALAARDARGDHVHVGLAQARLLEQRPLGQGEALAGPGAIQLAADGCPQAVSSPTADPRPRHSLKVHLGRQRDLLVTAGPPQGPRVARAGELKNGGFAQAVGRHRLCFGRPWCWSAVSRAGGGPDTAVLSLSVALCTLVCQRNTDTVALLLFVPCTPVRHGNSCADTFLFSLAPYTTARR